MNWTFASDLQQSALLGLGQISVEGDPHFDSVHRPQPRIRIGTTLCGNVRVRQNDMHSLKRPLFSAGVHLHRRTGTRSQRGQDQFERVRTRVFATVLARFVPLEHMRADGYVLDKSQRSRIYGYISRHIPPCICRSVRRKAAVLNTALVPGSHSIWNTPLTGYTIDRTTPPSTRKAAPFVAEESGLHTNVTSAATSSGLAKRFNSDVGRMARKNSRSTAAASVFCSTPSSWTNLSTPSDAVGPGSTELTVTFVPAVVSARPRATASCAVLVIP